MKRSLKPIIFLVLLAISSFFLVSHYARPNIIHGNSMESSIYDGDILLVKKLAPKDYKRGDIILFSTSLDVEQAKNAKLTKRIIGLPGDRVSSKEGLVYISGKMLMEPYLSTTGTYGIIDMIVPDQYVYVLGDNRPASIDSRNASIGLVPMEKIMGKAYLRLFPFTLFGEINNDK